MILRSDPWDMSLNLRKHETNDIRIHTMGVAWNLSQKTNTSHQSSQLTASTLDDSPVSLRSEEAEDLSIPIVANPAIRYDSESEDYVYPQTSPRFTDWSQSDDYDCQETPEDLSSTARPDCQENCSMDSIVEGLSPKPRKRRKQLNPVRITNVEVISSTTGISGKSRSQSCVSPTPLEALNLTLNQHDFDPAYSYENSPSSPCNTSRFPSAVCSHCKSTVPLTDFTKHLLENHAASFTRSLFGKAAEDRLIPSSNAYFPGFLTPVTSPSLVVHSTPPGGGSNSEAYCYLCDKEFCNKHEKKRKMKKNWTRSNSPTDTYSPLNLSTPYALPSSIPDSTSSSILTPPLSDTATVSALPTGFLGQLKAEVDGGGTGCYTGEVEQMPRRFSLPTRSYCEICQKELCNKYFMKKHMLKMHGIDLGSQSQLGGVTCDICNKEVCSKYFLKAHKQKTHGVCEEQVEPLALTTEKLTTTEKV